LKIKIFLKLKLRHVRLKLTTTLVTPLKAIYEVMHCHIGDIIPFGYICNFAISPHPLPFIRPFIRLSFGEEMTSSMAAFFDANQDDNGFNDSDYVDNNNNDDNELQAQESAQDYLLWRVGGTDANDSFSDWKIHLVVVTTQHSGESSDNEEKAATHHQKEEDSNNVVVLTYCVH
jgi:hypothetical protein